MASSLGLPEIVNRILSGLWQRSSLDVRIGEVALRTLALLPVIRSAPQVKPISSMVMNP